MIGCNRAALDFDLDHCVIIDRFAIAELIDDLPSHTQYWTKESALELPPGFKHLPAPGIDSGSLAIHLAHTLYPNNTILCIGFDGVLNGDTTNRYTYRFRNNNNQARPGIHQKHKRTIVRLAQEYPVCFVNDTPDHELETMHYDQAISLVRT
jgi:hypothetical protein